MPSVPILLVCKHPVRLINDTITLSGILSHQGKNNKNIPYLTIVRTWNPEGVMRTQAGVLTLLPAVWMENPEGVTDLHSEVCPMSLVCHPFGVRVLRHPHSRDFATHHTLPGFCRPFGANPVSGAWHHPRKIPPCAHNLYAISQLDYRL